VTAEKTSAISPVLTRAAGYVVCSELGKVREPCSPRRVDLGYQLCQGVTLLGFEFSQDGFEFFWHDLPPRVKSAATLEVGGIGFSTDVRAKGDRYPVTSPPPYANTAGACAGMPDSTMSAAS
jgi:hypothetical protein